MDIKTLEAAASVHPGVLGLLNRVLVGPTPADVAGALAARNGELSATLEEVNEHLLTEREEYKQFDWERLIEERDHAVARLAALEAVLRCWELFPARRKGTAAAEIRTAIAQTGSTDKPGL